MGARFQEASRNVPPPHDRFDKYEVIRRLGRGGMGTVYLARDPALDRLVAIKVLRDALLDDELLERFMREARAAANLRHENLITIYEVGQQDNQPFMAMEYVDGESLDKVIAAKQPLTVAERLDYLEQICAGLYHAHCAAIVHRDVKPANIMIDRRGLVRILDFGIARVEGSAMTGDGAMIGTLPYMSWEQMAGKPVDYRSDIFAVGAVAYELLSYQRAFNRTFDNASAFAEEEPVPLTQLCPAIPVALPPIVMRAMARQPESRFENLDEMRLALRQIRRSADPNLALEPEATRLLRPTGESHTPPMSTSRRDMLERRARQIAMHRDAARAALTRGDLDSAVAACEDALTLDPDDADALHLLGEIQQTKLRRDQESKERHDRQRTSRQRLADAEIQLSRGEVVAAAGQLQQALALDPHAPDAVALAARIKETASAAGISVRDFEISHLGATMSVGLDAIRTGRPQWKRRPIVLASIGVAVAAMIAAVVMWPFYRSEAPSSVGSGVAASPPSSTTSSPLTRSTSAPATTPTTAPASVDDKATLQRQLDRITTSYRRGDLDASLLLIKPLLETTNDSRVLELANAIAQSARRSMTAAANAAANRNAGQLAARTVALAEQSRTLAERAFSRKDFVEAGTQALMAAAIYSRAEREVVATTPASPPPPAVASAPISSPVSSPPPAAPAVVSPPPATPLLQVQPPCCHRRCRLHQQHLHPLSIEERQGSCRH
jgi:serine/threonine protein kinase